MSPFFYILLLSVLFFLNCETQDQWDIDERFQKALDFWDNKQYPEAVEKYLEIFQLSAAWPPPPAKSRRVGEMFLLRYQTEEFTFENYIDEYIEVTDQISTFMFLCGLSTDHLVDLFLKTKSVKLLPIFSLRNRQSISKFPFEAFSPHLNGLWYSQQWAIIESAGVLDERVFENAQILARINPNEFPVSELEIGKIFRFSSSVNPSFDIVKAPLNTYLQGVFDAQFPLPRIGRSEKARIAIFVEDLNPSSSAIRTFWKAIQTLSDYELSFFTIPSQEHFISQFPEPISVCGSDYDTCAQSLVKNKPHIIFYPSVGLCMASVVLSNLRLAPIQITTYGHPFSSRNSKIDVFIGSELVELQDAPHHRYGEQLVLIAGLGFPLSEFSLNPSPLPVPTTLPVPSPQASISIFGGPPDIHFWILRQLTEILKISEKKSVLLKFYPESEHMSVYGVFISYLESKLRIAVQVKEVDISDQQKVIEEIETSDLVLHNFPTLRPKFFELTLRLGVPAIVKEGTFFVERYGAAFYKYLNIKSLIAINDQDFVWKNVELLQNRRYYCTMQNRLISTIYQQSPNPLSVLNQKYLDAFQQVFKHLLFDGKQDDHTYILR